MTSDRSEPQRGERPVVEGDGRTSRDEDYAVRNTEDRGETYGDPDVVLDVPTLNVEEIDLEVEDLQVRVALQAVLADLVQINVGLKAELDEVKLGVKGVEAQVQLKARLDNVRAIFSEVLESLQYSPQFFRQALGSVNETTGAPEDTTPDTDVVDETGDVSGPPAGGGAEERGEPEATEAARNKARDLGVDLSGLKGTGSGWRIILSDARVKRVREYVQGEEFKADRERVRRDAAERLKNVRERYRAKRRDPETAARERKLTLRLAEVEAEAAELRIQLSVLLEEEEELRRSLDEL